MVSISSFCDNGFVKRPKSEIIKMEFVQSKVIWSKLNNIQLVLLRIFFGKAFFAVFGGTGRLKKLARVEKCR